MHVTFFSTLFQSVKRRKLDVKNCLNFVMWLYLVRTIYIRINIHTYKHTYVDTYIRTYKHTYVQSCIYIHKHTHPHHARIHAYTHTHIHTYTHKHIHT